MEQVEACGAHSQTVLDSLNRMKTEWPTNQNISSNPTNSTLLYIAVEYVKEEFKSGGLSPCENFNNFRQHVSTLDPNMSSVARYSPVYNDSSNNYNPVIIHQLVASENDSDTTFVNNLDTNSSLEALPTVLCNTDINNVDNQFLQMVDSGIVSSDNTSLQGLSNNDIPNKEQKVEVLITDQATGISYSVQELLVEDQQLLEALSPNPLLDGELLTIDETILKNNLPEVLINPNSDTGDEPNMITNFISNFPSIKTEFPNTENESKLRKRSSPNVLETEDTLLSRVYSIVDKPIPTRAWATLPETHLKIYRIDEEWAVFAKKCIRKRTQFGPVQGVLKNKEDIFLELNKLELLVQDEEGGIMGLDISDEEQANWMCFIRKAENYAEQNLVVSQHENSLYFTVIRNILPKQELKVGYSYIYANQHNLTALEKQPVEEHWPCFECMESFSSWQDLQDHLNVHDEDREKVKFKKKFWRRRKRVVKITTTEACQCRICQQIFNPPKWSVLKNHLLSKHDISDKCIEDHFFIIRNFKCDTCNVVFNSEKLFKIHNLQHKREKNDDNSDDETYHICPACKRKFPTQRQLVLHVSIHSLPKYKRIPERFHCPVCPTTYPIRERLQQHMLIHGPEENKPLQCPHCTKRFMNNSALTCHVKTHISGEDIYECPICKDRFDHVPKLKNHVQKHCVNNTYTCPQCNKKFKAYCVIRKHIRAHHGEHKHSCQHCSKFFPTIDKLKAHLLKHSDHKEFLCADCGKQFKRKDKLNEHCRRVHREERENDAPQTKTNAKSEPKALTKVEPMDFDRFIYKCHPCLIGFKRRGMLVNHLAKRHPDISLDSVPELNLPILRATKDYYCQYCDKVYKSSSKRKTHILKNHPGAALPISNRKQAAYSETAGLPNPSFSQTVGSVTTSPQNCKWCHKQYASKAKLMNHQRKEHPEFLEGESATSKEVKMDIEEHGPSYKEIEFADTDKILSADIMDEFEDDVDENIKYCHLVNNTENDVFRQDDNLNLPSSQLYRLLTNTDSMVPPR